MILKKEKRLKIPIIFSALTFNAAHLHEPPRKKIRPIRPREIPSPPLFYFKLSRSRVARERRRRVTLRISKANPIGGARKSRRAPSPLTPPDNSAKLAGDAYAIAAE